MQSSLSLPSLGRDRFIVIAGLTGVIVLAWAYTAYLGLTMPGMGNTEMGGEIGMAMPVTQAWGAVDLLAMFVMWAVMMTAMMVPSATPMMLMVASVNRRLRQQDQPYAPTAVFLAGYVAMWSLFAGGATLTQWGLHEATLLSPIMVSTSKLLGSVLLIGAGAYQLSSLKTACLNGCRSPLGFVMKEWRDGASGAFSMGLRHGTYCLGCCWMLMALLFVLGVMNLLWIAALSTFVLVEKVAPGGRWLSRSSGVLLLVWGAALPFVG